MKVTEENIKWAVKMLTRLRHMEKFPQDKEYMRDIACCFLRIVKNKPYQEWVDSDPEYAEFLAPGQSDADWLIQTILETQSVFPMPVRMRVLYYRRFVPENDKQMQVVIDDNDPY